jgi:hypothetical protein
MKQTLTATDDRARAGLINMRVRIHVAYGLIATTYIATICSILFGCYPLHKNWQIYPDPGSESLIRFLLGLYLTEFGTNHSSLDHCQPAVSKIDIYVTVVLNVATDIYLISIPAPVSYYNLNLPR